MPSSPSRPRFVPLVASLMLTALAATTGCSRSRSESARDAPPVQAAPSPMRPGDQGALGAGQASKESGAAGARGGNVDESAPASKLKPGEEKPAAAARALVVTIDLAVIAENPDALTERLRTETERAGGFVADATASGAGEGRSSRLVLRLPAAQARNLRPMLADYGKITTATEKSEDVTEQRADLGARLSNAQAQEKRLVEIMAHRTGGVAEVLEVERELARVRETIERFDAQKRTLDGKIDLATVTVSITTPASAPLPPREEGALARIAEAFHDGVHATGVLLLYGAMALAATSPVLVPLLLAATALVVFLRRRRRALRARG